MFAKKFFKVAQIACAADVAHFTKCGAITNQKEFVVEDLDKLNIQCTSFVVSLIFLLIFCYIYYCYIIFCVLKRIIFAFILILSQTWYYIDMFYI